MSNIVINGATYKDVPSIQVPNESGEMVEFVSHDLEDNLIEGTVTEYINDRITVVNTFSLASKTKMKMVDLPNVTTLNNQCLRYCTALTDVRVPKIKKILLLTFGNDTSLKCVNLHNLESIGSQAFFNCSSLYSVIIASDRLATAQKSDCFSSTPIASGTGYIYVPSALVGSYKSATNWSVYANQFRALEDYTVDGTITGELDESKI